LRCIYSYYTNYIILQIAFVARRVLLIANRVWRCNMTFRIIIATAKMHKQERRSELVLGCRSPSRSCIYTGGVIRGLHAVPLHCILYTHSRSGHPAGRFPRLVCPVSPPGLTTYFLASCRHPSHCIFSCTSCASRFAWCASRLYRVVICGRMHKSQCCAVLPNVPLLFVVMLLF